MTLLDRIRQPAREQPLVLAGVLLAAVVAVIAVVALNTGGAPRPRRPMRTADPMTLSSAQRAVIGTRPAPALTTAQVADARQTARRFLVSYLPILYGRRAPETVRDASSRVRAELRDAARSPRAPRKRRPRITHLVTRARGDHAVIAVAVISDSVTRPYQIALQLDNRDQRWQVTQISNY